MIGTTVDRYEILEELGHGGMSVVYRGRDESLERDVAVKVLHKHLAKKHENRARFHREAKAIARLRHNNILEVYDFSGEGESLSYIVMEYIEGKNLRQFITATGTPPPEVAALIGVEICNALEHAHDHNIIHRDLKPENVMISADGQLKLMDFGIAHVIDAETMTATGSLMGSPAHMAPELIDGKKVDVRADVFALGTVLYWLSTGSLPFEGANAPQVLKRVLEGDYEDAEAAEPRVGGEMSALIDKCLAHDPQARFATVAEARKALLGFARAGGIESESDAELRGYFSNPPLYREEFEARIIGHLISRARAAEKAKQVPTAVGLFNRILAYDPNNREVQRLVDNLCRRARYKRIAPVALAAVAVLALIAYVVTRPAPAVIDPPEPDPLATTSTDPAEVALAIASKAAEMPKDPSIAEQLREASDAVVQAHNSGRTQANNDPRPSDRPTDPRRTVRRPSEPTNVAAATPDAGATASDAGAPASVLHKWAFPITPAAATFKVDGQVVDTFTASMGIELEEGVHELWARGTGTKPYSRRIDVKGPNKLPIVLEWEPGRVEVSSNVPMLVWFNGAEDPERVNGRGSFTVPFGAANSTESSKPIRVRAAHVKYPAQAKQQNITVKAGDVSKVTFTFPKQ